MSDQIPTVTIKSPSVELSGVMTVLPTPFDDGCNVDHAALVALVDHSIHNGSRGLVCFGLASELYKLTDSERSHIVETVITHVSGRVPVIVGSESNSIETAVQRTAAVCAAGADAVMVLPPSFVKTDERTIIEYFSEVARAASGAPIVVQDAPTWTGVTLSVDLLCHVRELAPNVSHVKVENPPNYDKIVALSQKGFGCVGGYGALHLLEDIDAGVCGVMSGAGSVSTMVRLWEASRSDMGLAWDIFEHMLPVLAFQMTSLDLFIAVQKHLLHRDGILTSTAIRRPGRPLSRHQVEWLELLLKRQEGNHQ